MKTELKQNYIDPFAIPDPETIRQKLDEHFRTSEKLKKQKKEEEIKKRSAPKGICRVCKGFIYASYRSEYDPRTGPLICGPGSKNQYVEHVTYSCRKCCIRYASIPYSGDFELLKRENGW